MLSNHINAGSESEPAPDAYRVKFLNHLSAIGWWPSSLRRVAIINGNRTGYDNPMAPENSSLLHYDQSPWYGIYQNIDWNVIATSKWARDKSMHCYTLNSFLPTLTGIAWGWTNSYHTPGSNHAALDCSPGSFFNNFNSLDNKWLDLYMALHHATLTMNIANFTFVPTISSADYYPSPLGFNLNKDFTNEIMSTCTNNTTFAWVYSQTNPTAHVAVDNTIGNWFYHEN